MSEIIVHIGHHKTGSTWLQTKYFSSPPFQVINDYLTPWNDDLCNAIIAENNGNKASQIIKARLDPSKINIISAERLSGHPISGGYDMLSIANCLKELNHDLKIIIVRREPASFVKSCYQQLVREGYTGSLSQLLGMKYWKTSGPKITYFKQELICQQYKELFGPEKVLILDFEEFIDNKCNFLVKINAFVGSKMDVKLDEIDQKVGESNSNRMTRALRFLNKFKQSEFNPSPGITMGNQTRHIIGKLISLFYSNKDLDGQNIISKYLNQQ